MSQKLQRSAKTPSGTLSRGSGKMVHVKEGQEMVDFAI